MNAIPSFLEQLEMFFESRNCSKIERDNASIKIHEQVRKLYFGEINSETFNKNTGHILWNIIKGIKDPKQEIPKITIQDDYQMNIHFIFSNVNETATKLKDIDMSFQASENIIYRRNGFIDFSAKYSKYIKEKDGHNQKNSYSNYLLHLVHDLNIVIDNQNTAIYHDWT